MIKTWISTIRQYFNLGVRDPLAKFEYDSTFNPNEVGFVHPATGAYVKMTDDGSAEFIANENCYIRAMASEGHVAIRADKLTWNGSPMSSNVWSGIMDVFDKGPTMVVNEEYKESLKSNSLGSQNLFGRDAIATFVDSPEVRKIVGQPRIGPPEKVESQHAKALKEFIPNVNL